MCNWVDQFPSGPSKKDSHAWTASPKATCRGIPCFRDLFLGNWRLHARIISETSHQMSLPLDLWHARHNLNVIKTHQPDAAKLIPHINLVVLTSHITSMSCWHIQLSYFGVSPLSLHCVAFLSLFVFSLVWVLFVWFHWMLVVVYKYTSLS